MRAGPLLPALLLLLLGAAPAPATDLSGLWQVEGTLEDGSRYSGHVTLSPKGESWELVGQALFEGGAPLVWRAAGSLEGQQLTLVRGQASGGAVGVIAGGDGQAGVSAVYALAADGRRLEGQVDLPGPAGVASERYLKVGAPAGRFARERVVLRRGESVEVGVSLDPAEALGVAFVGGARPSHVVVSRPAPDRVLIHGRAPGATALLLRLGAHGPVLARLPLEVRPSLLQETLERVREQAATGKKPVVIFDLDDTLFDTRPRTLAILRAYPHEPRLAALELHQVVHGLPETLMNAGFSAAEVEGEKGEKVRRFWSKRFFDDESLRLDAPIPGAVEYVRALVAAGAHPVYLTGRQEQTRQLSQEVLDGAGFPAGTLFLKPNPGPNVPKESTPAFKGRIARSEVPNLGLAVAAFDNEPANCNAFRESLPAAATVVFLDTLYPDDSPALTAGIDALPDFLE